MGETIDTSNPTHNEDVWLFAPDERNIESEFGERLLGDMLGMALDDADLQVGDQVDDGNTTYEVEDLVYKPNETDKQFMLLSLVKLNNDA